MKTTILLAWRYLANRRFATSVSILAIALSLVFIVAVGVVNFAVKKTAVEGSIRYPLIVGPASASGVQLILSAIFHIDKPAGTIPFGVYEALKADNRVIAAYPVAVADSFKNIRIIGVNQAFLDDLNAGASAGAIDLSNLENAVFGHAAAMRTGVKIGDTFHGQHGMVGAAGAHQHKELAYKVVGIMNPTGAAEDTAIYTQYQSVWHIHEKHKAHHHNHESHEKEAKPANEASDALAIAEGEKQAKAEKMAQELGLGIDMKPEYEKPALKQEHAHEGHERHEGHEGHEHGHDKGHDEHEGHEHGHDKGHDKYVLGNNMLTAVLVRTANPAFTGMLEREYSLRDGTLAVDTGKSIRDFVAHINKGEIFVKLVSAAMLAIALVMILVTLIMSINERKKELALLRMLGVGRGTLSLVVMLEALFLTVFGALLGLVMGHVAAFLAQDWIKEAAGVVIEAWTMTDMEITGFWVTLIAGQALAFIAMLFTYRMNVVEEVARD